MPLTDREREWGEKASRFLKAELKRAGVAEIFTPGAPLGQITGWLEQALDRRETAGAS